MKVSYAKLRFREHRKGANSRGISFQFTFEEWYNWWLSNGVDRNIPRANNGSTLCMCRYGDTGPYHPSNVYCATKSQNNIDAHKNNSTRGGSSKLIQTPYGIFQSKTQAAKSIGIHTTTISTRLKKDPNAYYYL